MMEKQLFETVFLWLDENEYLSDNKFFNELFFEAVRKKKSNILLNAGLGTGKTHFILDVLVDNLLNALDKHNVNKDGVILILTNRDALKQQIEQQYNLDSAYIEVMNYQALEQRLVNGNPPQNAQVIIADECHYFFCDSSFNRQSDIAFDQYLMRNTKGIKILISATPEMVVDYLKNKHFLTHEFQIKKNRNIDCQIYYFWSESVIKDQIDYLIENTNDKILLFRNDESKNKTLVNPYSDRAVSITAKTGVVKKSAVSKLPKLI